MQQIVINTCFGGFGLSHEGIQLYAKLKGIKLYSWIDDISKSIYKERATLDSPYILVHYCTVPVKDNTEYEMKQAKSKKSIYWLDHDLKRNDPILIKVITRLKKRANGKHADLKIVSIPDDIQWEIKEYDGNEWVAEKHRTWD